MTTRALVVGYDFPSNAKARFGSIAKFLHPQKIVDEKVGDEVRMLLVYQTISSSEQIAVAAVAEQNRLQQRTVESEQLLNSVLESVAQMNGGTLFKRFAHKEQ